jgi:BirA family transcriptional regulator, biotin operon repressor / biotin---[acetyl-CoA-carboxylase] ligase
MSEILYIHLETIDSTNAWAKSHASTLDPTALTCIIAEEQTVGRGRLSKRWVSPKGQNLYASFYFCLPLGFSHLGNIGQVLSISCCKVLLTLGFSPQIKWPNDLLLAEKKVAGVLTETLPLGDQTGVIAGIGVNVNMSPELLNTIDQPATSLAQVSGRTWQIQPLVEALAKQFLADLVALEQKGFAPLRPFYEEALASKGKTITCRDGTHTWKGICHSVNEDGRLNLMLPSGEMVALSAGEIQ